MNLNILSSLIRGTLLALCISLTVSSGVHAQKAHSVSLQDLSSFSDPGETWHIAGGVTAPLEKENTFHLEKGSGILINNPQDQRGKDLFTNFKHGDIDLELDFMMAKNANSGIYFQGRYEMQLLDSWATKNPSSGDNGGIYERWDNSRPDGRKGYQGYAPRQNASRAPGLWQHLEVSFQAPRFDSKGNKIENAKILKATLNGVTIHEDVELLGPTRGAVKNNEVAQASLRFQGDHGAVAFKNIKVTRFSPPTLEVHNLEYQVYEGSFTKEPALDSLTVVRKGNSPFLTSNLGALPDQFLLRYTGAIHNKENGKYTFDFNPQGGSGILKVGNKEVIATGNREGTVSLPKGKTPFELLYLRRSNWRQPSLGLSVTAENIRPQQLSDNKIHSRNSGNPIYVKAKDKALLRSFMDLPNGERITHAISVSSGKKVHYTYDLATGNLIQVWRGNFLNATPMWYSRGDGSSRPQGTVEHLLDSPSPVVYKLEDKKSPWPKDLTGTEFKTSGYELSSEGEPTFRYSLYGAAVEDRIKVTPEGKGVERTLTFDKVRDDVYLRLAQGKTITKGAKNQYLVDNQSYYLKVNQEIADSAFIRTVDDRQELLVPVHSTVNYTILF